GNSRPICCRRVGVKATGHDRRRPTATEALPCLANKMHKLAKSLGPPGHRLRPEMFGMHNIALHLLRKKNLSVPVSDNYQFGRRRALVDGLANPLRFTTKGSRKNNLSNLALCPPADFWMLCGCKTQTRSNGFDRNSHPLIQLWMNG